MSRAKLTSVRNISTLTNLASKAKGAWKTIFRKTETPREIQERHDLYRIALATTFRQLRRNDEKNNSDGGVRNGNASMSNRDKSELEKLYDQAVDTLEKEVKAHDMSLRALRFHCQSLIQPQAINLLQTCKDIDTRFNFPHGECDTDDEDKENEALVEKTCRKYIMREKGQVMDTIILEQENNTAASGKHLKFLKQKLETLQIISAFYGWEKEHKHENHDSVHAEDDDQCMIHKDHTGIHKHNNKGDAFGYYINQNEDINKSIRRYQMINLTKALLIKEHLGYATVALKSTVQGAGRGVFIDGFAPAGSLISFFPGKIWPKEYLLNVKAASAIFDNDPKQQLSLRYDDTLVDSRRAPYTVLDDVNSNAFSIGHIVNHPPRTVLPNCSTTTINFMEFMKLEKKRDSGGLDLAEYVPNTYVKPPMMFGPNAMDLEKISMHSFGLIAARDLENEELFYDYRLSPGEGDASGGNGASLFPDWYHVCDEESLNNRWNHT